MTGSATRTDQTLINALRCLSMDMVQAANSGHPGLPLGAAPMAYALFSRHLRFDPGRPDWFARDRFILSPGHGSALLYSLLHLFGYEVSLDDLKTFRQLGSKCAGHPEAGLVPGVECTTGPLGQGFANGVGMAIAGKWFSARYGSIADHMVYGLVSDGDLMEGVAVEAASLAGHLGLGNLVYLYDSNDISLDGPCDKAYTEDVRGKFEAMGWQVLEVADGNNLEEINQAVDFAKAEVGRPSLVIVKTVIGFASPLAGSSKSHGAPLGAENVLATKQALGVQETGPFALPDGFGEAGLQARSRGSALTGEWEERFAAFQMEKPALAKELACLIDGGLPDGWDSDLENLAWPDGSVATRESGHAALNAIASNLPWMAGGAADLASSTKASIAGGGDFNPADFSGRNIWFGVREHAMGAIVNGMALSGMRAFGSTFLVFSDYMRGSIRLAALSNLTSWFIFTHDSVFVGEDGPTHQPIEHVEALRLIPGLQVYRPADALECKACYLAAMRGGQPAAFALTRQGVPVLNAFASQIAAGTPKGAYVLSSRQNAVATLLATGSEVALALEAQGKLESEGIGVDVVSMPCRELFSAQDQRYRDSVLPPGRPVVCIEAGVTQGWLGMGRGNVAAVGIDRFGESGPGGQVYSHLGMKVDHVVETVRTLIKP